MVCGYLLLSPLVKTLNVIFPSLKGIALETCHRAR